MAQDTPLAQETPDACPPWAVSQLRVRLSRMAEALERAQTPEDLRAVKAQAREHIHELAGLQGVDPVVRGQVLQVLEQVEAEASPGLLSGLAAAICHCKNLRPQVDLAAR